MKIFILENKPYFYSYIDTHFELENLELKYFYNAQTLIESIIESPPDIIISGTCFDEQIEIISLIKKVRNTLNYKGKFIIATTYPDNSPEKYLENGADKFFDKNMGFNKIFNQLIIENNLF